MEYNASYALNGKIMLCSVTILFLLVLTMVCFHSHHRRNSHRRNSHRRRQARHLFNQPVTPNAATNSTDQGLHPSVLKALSTFTYSPITHGHGSPLECAVCLSEFEDGERGRVLPKCEHTFHVHCIDTWFYSHSKCPLCRAPVHADISAETENKSAGSQTERGQRVAAEMGCSGFSERVSLEPSDGHRKLLELVGIVVEVPRLRGLYEIGSASPGVHGFKSSGNRVLSMKRIWSI